MHTNFTGNNIHGVGVVTVSRQRHVQRLLHAMSVFMSLLILTEYRLQITFWLVCRTILTMFEKVKLNHDHSTLCMET